MFFNILLLLVLTVRTDKGNAESKTTFTALFRKQNRPYKMTPPFAQGSKKKGQVDSYYEPYWDNGDWVYYRGESTSRPHPFFLNVGNTTEHDECNPICPEFVQNYGTVCGAKYNEYYARYDYKTFEDYCYMELENCYSALKRLSKYFSAQMVSD